MLSPEQDDLAGQDQRPECMDGREKPMQQIDRHLRDGSNPQRPSHDLLVIVEKKRTSARRSERRSGQRDSCTGFASYKQLQEVYTASHSMHNSTRRNGTCIGQHDSCIGFASYKRVQEAYNSSSLVCNTKRCSEGRSGQHSPERRTRQQESCTDFASYKRLPGMADRRADRITGRTPAHVSDYGEVPYHELELVGAPVAPSPMAGIASMLIFSENVEQQKSEGYGSVMDTEYINPRS